MILLVMLLTGALLFLTAPGYGDDAKDTEFVDFDGDGINDNESDNDGNSIPDCFENKDSITENSEPEVRSILGNVFNSDKSFKNNIALRTNTDKFGSMAFKIRGIPQRCHGFGTVDEFGSGTAVGVSSSSSGCVGGVCIR